MSGGWREWRITHRATSRAYVLGIISGSGSQGTGSGWRLLYVHFRGKQRMLFALQIGDHSSYLAPYNELRCTGPSVPYTPSISV